MFIWNKSPEILINCDKTNIHFIQICTHTRVQLSSLKTENIEVKADSLWERTVFDEQKVATILSARVYITLFTNMQHKTLWLQNYK